MPRNRTVNPPPYSSTSTRWETPGRDNSERDNLLPRSSSPPRSNYGSDNLPQRLNHAPVVAPPQPRLFNPLNILVCVMIILNITAFFYPSMVNVRSEWAAEGHRYQAMRNAWNSERKAMEVEREAWQKERADYRLEHEALIAEKEQWRKD
ncbi:hypothetical protein BYT27DRAFT_6547703 [Phlegmacium glaucopus]|nr:hypothetical protein BYT27DRAFT_6547703 [Phlegmacium glaucopus]